MNPTAHNGGNGSGNGWDDGFDEPVGERPRKRDRRGFDDFDDLIRDPEYAHDDPDDPFESFSPGWDDPAERYRSARSRSGGATGAASGVTDAVLHLIEMLAGAAGDALPPDSRRRLESMLLDLLVAIRDSIDGMIERLEERVDHEVEIEEIQID